RGRRSSCSRSELREPNTSGPLVVATEHRDHLVANAPPDLRRLLGVQAVAGALAGGVEALALLPSTELLTAHTHLLPPMKRSRNRNVTCVLSARTNAATRRVKCRASSPPLLHRRTLDR